MTAPAPPPRPERTLSRDEARAFYDRLGARLDSQRVYEDRALHLLVTHAGFDRARAVVEFGCGTGRFARRLLAGVLAPECRYLGVDASPAMVALARARLAPWADRAAVRLTDGSPVVAAPDGGFDRFVSTYVLDLLSREDIAAVLGEAHRVLAAGGRLCVVSLTEGRGPLARLVTGLWKRVHALRPSLLGGCRPLRLLDHLPATHWRVEHREVVSPFGIASEVIVAARVPAR